jgi:hypothetical protein
MQLIKAFWEKQNLGVSCLEIVANNQDSLNELSVILDDTNNQYLVVKLPSDRPDLIELASAKGFSIVEALFSVSKSIKHLTLPPVTSRLISQIEHRPFEDRDFDELFREINKGMFNTDRVSRDSVFGPEFAAKRYISWIKTEHVNGSAILKLIFKNKTIGFFTLKDLGNGTYYPFLAGVYSDYRNHGIGLAMAYKPLLETKNLGGTAVSTWISTNNLPAIRIHVALSFSFDSVFYVLVKHNCQ